MNLFYELYRHRKLADRRSSLYDKNKYAQYFILLASLFWLGYLIFFGVIFAFAFDESAREPYHVMSSGFIFVLIMDFLLRLSFQKTPTQEIKPYLLLPIRKSRLIDFLLIRSGLSAFNFVWLFMFVPFAILTITRFYGFWGVFSFCLGTWLLIVINNYWYLLCRTLIGHKIYWVALPVLVYAAIGAAIIIPEDSFIANLSVDIGEGFIQGNLLTFGVVIAVIALLRFINHIVISWLVYNELNKVEDTKVKHVSEYRFLDRYGEIGEYIRLEMKMLTRNKMCRRSLISITCIVVCFTMTLSFTDVYDGSWFGDFLIIYNYLIFGLTFLSKIMSFEGNYIDGLISRKESILSLLKAKYILYSIALCIPTILVIPAVVTGKTTLLTCITWQIFTMGAVYFGLFQLTIYNDQTMPLDKMLANKMKMGGAMQNLISGAAFVVPMIMARVLRASTNETVANVILCIIGIIFIITSNLWIKNVYKRFMKRRYKNMEGFRDTRDS